MTLSFWLFLCLFLAGCIQINRKINNFWLNLLLNIYLRWYNSILLIFCHNRQRYCLNSFLGLFIYYWFDYFLFYLLFCLYRFNKFLQLQILRFLRYRISSLYFFFLYFWILNNFLLYNLLNVLLLFYLYLFFKIHLNFFLYFCLFFLRFGICRFFRFCFVYHNWLNIGHNI